LGLRRISPCDGLMVNGLCSAPTEGSSFNYIISGK
jgi:hypothetical protein